MKPSPWCALVLALTVAACHYVAPAHLPTGDAGTAQAAAAAVCPHLRALGCPEGSPSKAGESCEALVQRVPFALPLQCAADATELDEIRACGIKCGLTE